MSWATWTLLNFTPVVKVIDLCCGVAGDGCWWGVCIIY